MIRNKYNTSKILENCPNIQSDNNGIYMITNTSNNKRYIGTSANCIRRCMQHYGMLATNTHTIKRMQEDFNNCGMNYFEFKVLYNYELEDDPYLYSIEKLFIAVIKPEYNTAHVKWGYLCNDGLDTYPKFEKIILSILNENILSYLGDYFIEEFDQEEVII